MTSLAFCFALKAANLIQRYDPYVDLASRLPSVVEAEKFNSLESAALKEGSYMSFLGQAAAAYPEFNARLAAANEWMVRERREPTALVDGRYKAAKDIAKDAMRWTSYLANRGDLTGAVGTCTESMKMSRVAFKGGPIIDHLVSVAVYAIASNSLRSISQVIPVDQAKLLQSEADAATSVSTYQDHLKSELAYVQANNKVLSDMVGELQGDDQKETAKKIEALTPIERQALLSRAAARLSDFFERVETIVGGESKTTLRDLDRLVEGSSRGKDLEDAYVVDYAGLIKQGFRAEIKKRVLARVVWLYAAVDIYRANHGDLPESLDQAVPADRLVEPFTGLRFEYGRHENAFWIELPDNSTLGGKTGLKWVRSTSPSSATADGDIPPR